VENRRLLEEYEEDEPWDMVLSAERWISRWETWEPDDRQRANHEKRDRNRNFTGWQAELIVTIIDWIGLLILYCYVESK
jgi:hypothetical protein